MYVQDNLGMCNEVVESLARYASGRDYRPVTVCGTHRPYQLGPSRGFLPVEKHVIQHVLRLHLLDSLQGFDPLYWMVARPVTENIGEELDVLQVVIPDFVSLFEPYSRIRVNPWAPTVELLHVVDNQLVVGMLRFKPPCLGTVHHVVPEHDHGLFVLGLVAQFPKHRLDLLENERVRVNNNHKSNPF